MSQPPPQYQPPVGQLGGYPQQFGQPPPQQGYPTTNTTVIVQQPVASTAVVLQPGMRNWNSDLCGCFEDIESCKLYCTIMWKTVQPSRFRRDYPDLG